MPTLVSQNKVPSAVKDKANLAIKVCRWYMERFLKKLQHSIPAKDYIFIHDLVEANCFFAGGVFRSILTDTPINDIDIYFRSETAAAEFVQHVSSVDSDLFTMTRNNSFNVKLPPYPGLKNPVNIVMSFITNRSGEPDTLLDDFDFTFNQHYYDPLNESFRFDLDTVAKVGRVCYIDNATAVMLRATRFLRDGFKIPQDNIIVILSGCISQYMPPSFSSPNSVDILHQARSAFSSPHTNSKDISVKTTGEFWTDKSKHYLVPAPTSAGIVLNSVAHPIAHSNTSQVVQYTYSNGRQETIAIGESAMRDAFFDDVVSGDSST